MFDFLSKKLFNKKMIVYKFKPFVFESVSCSWSKPCARSGHRVVSDDRYMYTYGGFNPSGRVLAPSATILKELWRLDLYTGVWRMLNVDEFPPYPTSPTVVLLGNVLLTYGGSGLEFGANSSNKIYVCDLKQNVLDFKEIAALGNLPTPGYGQATFYHEDKLFVVGGTSGYDFWSDIHSFDVKTNVWKCVSSCRGLENEPDGRYRHTLAFYQNKIYIIGGGTTNDSYSLIDINVFSLKTNRWEIIKTCTDKTFPPPRRYHSSVQKDNLIFIFGGVYGPESLDDTWYLNMDDNRWTHLPTMNLHYPTFFHDSCLTSYGKVFLFGGVSKKSRFYAERCNDVLTGWICIPSLKEIAWEALLFYKLHKNESIKTLIPEPFKRRLNNFEN